MSWARRWLVLLTALGTCLVAGTLSPEPVAFAHAVFVSATPAPGAVLRTPPTSVRIVFSEPLEASLSGVRLYASSGHRVPLRSARIDARDPRAYGARLPDLHADRYTVVWHTVSAIDGHSRRGSYTFTVDRPDGSPPRIQHAGAPGTGSPPSVPTAGQAAANWFGLAGLFLLAGATLLTLLGTGLRVTEALRVRRWLRRFALTGVAGLAAGTIGALISSWAPAAWDVESLRSILSSPVGHWWEIRVALAVVVVATWASPTGPVRRWMTWTHTAAVSAIAYSFSATAHGAASLLPTLGLGYEFVHVLASSAWLGGAAALAVVWALTRSEQPGDRHALLHRYSLVAAVAVPAVLASGLGNSVLELGAVGDLVSSDYGVSLLAKLVLAFVLMGVAGTNAVLVHTGRLRGRRLNRTIAIEAALGLAVLVPTAAMSVLAPPRPTDVVHTTARQIPSKPDPADAYTGETQLRGRDVDISVTPAAVGVNAIRVEVDGRYGVAVLHLSLTGPGDARTTADLSRVGYDHDPGTHTIYRGSLRFDREGSWLGRLRSADGSAAAAPLVIPVSEPVPGVTKPSGSTGVAHWLALIALAGLAVAVAAATRGLPNRVLPARARRVVTLTVGGVGLAAALVWAGALASTPGRADSAPVAGWGRARSVTPVSLPGETAWSIPTPSAGLMMPAVGPDGSVWVAEMDSNKLARLDPRRNVVQEFSFPGGYRETMGIAVAADGRVWLAQEHAMSLGEFDAATGHYREFPIPGGVSAPVGIAVGPHGNVWFTEMSGNKIGRFNPNTLRFNAYPIPTPNATPYWLAIAPDGRAWFAEFRTGKVGVLDPRTGRIREYAAPGHPNIAGIAVGQDGTVWFTTIQGSLFDLVPATGRLHRTRLPEAGEYGVAVSDGTVWVGRQAGRTVYAVDAASGRLQRHRLPAHSAPWWPTVGPRGHVWITLAGDRGNGLAELHK